MSSPDQHLTYLVTGIGLELLKTYLSRPNSTVIATIRDPTSASSLTLPNLPKSHGTTLIILKIDNYSPTDAKSAMQTLHTVHQIDKLDIVIANAAVQNHVIAPLATVDPAQVQEHIHVNAIGTLVLFQAVLPLLQKASAPKFVLLGSPLGSIGGMEKRPLPMNAYGVSKAAAHYLIRKIHIENQGLVAFAIDPGFVQTESGNKAAQAFGMKEARTPVAESVGFLVGKIDGATREDTSGRFPSIEGGDWAW